MNKGQISRQVIVDRLGWLGRMIQTIRDLPLDDSQAFFSDARCNIGDGSEATRQDQPV